MCKQQCCALLLAHRQPLQRARTRRAAGFFPTVTPFLKAPAGSGEEAEARAKMEGELQAIEAFLSAPVRACVHVCVCACVHVCVCVHVCAGVHVV